MILINDIYLVIQKFIIYNMHIFNRVNKFSYSIYKDFIKSTIKIQKCYRRFILKQHLQSKIIYRNKNINCIDLLWDPNYSKIVYHCYKTNILCNELSKLFSTQF